MFAFLLFKQMIMMFIMMSCGFILVRAKVLRSSDSGILAKLVVWLFFPCAIIRAFRISHTPEVRDGLVFAFALALAAQVVLILSASVIGSLAGMNRIEILSMAYPNTGNLIVPIVSALMGEEFVIYISAFSCIQLVFMWTHGISVIREQKAFSVCRILLNGNIIAVFFGCFLFFTGMPLPDVLDSTIDAFAGTVAPLAMLAIGMLLADIQWKKALRNPRVYLVIAVRMILLPGILALFFRLAGFTGPAGTGKTILLIVMLGATAPTAAMVTQLAQIYLPESGHEETDERLTPEYAGMLNAATTLSAIVTMPLMMMFFLEL